MSDLCPVAVSPADSNGFEEIPDTASEAHLWLLRGKKLCDLTFSFKNLPDQIPAHKIYLQARSSVFRELFRLRKSGNVDDTKEIEITESTPERFREFLEYIYADKFEVDIAGALDLLPLAQKYKVQSLIRKCDELIKKDIQVEHSLQVFETARRYERKELMERAGDIMAKSLAYLIGQDALLNAEEETITYLLQRNDLTVREVELFKFILKWGEKQSSGSDEKQLLNDKLKNVVPMIRYTNMTPQEFTDVVMPKSLLPLEDSLSVYMYFGGNEISRKDFKLFNTTPRKRVKFEDFVDFYAGKPVSSSLAPFKQCIRFEAERTDVQNAWSDFNERKAAITGIKCKWPDCIDDGGSNHCVDIDFNVYIKEYIGLVKERNLTHKFQKSLLKCKPGGDEEILVEPPVELKSGATYCVIVEDQSTSDENDIQYHTSRMYPYSGGPTKDIKLEASVNLEGVCLKLKKIHKDMKYFGREYCKKHMSIDVIRGVEVGLVKFSADALPATVGELQQVHLVPCEDSKPPQ